MRTTLPLGSRLWPITGGLVLATVIAFAVAWVTVWSASSLRESLLGVLAVLILAPIIYRVIQRRFDPFEPIIILAVCLFVLFVLRPIAHLAYGQMRHGDLSLEHGFTDALIISVVGVGALYVGYSLGAGKGVARRLRPLPSTLKPVATIAFAVSLIAVGMVFYALYIDQIGGLDVAKKLIRGRDPGEGQYVVGATVYFLFGPFLAIPATLLLLEAAAGRRRALFVGVTAIATALGLVVITAPSGERLWLMLLVMGIFTLPYLRAQKRPRMRILVLITVAWFALGVTFLGTVRVGDRREAAAPGSVLKKTAANPFHGWKSFILGGDTEMFAIMALEAERVPSAVPHEPGLTLVSLAMNWIPRAFYADKPQTTDDKVYAMLFPRRVLASRAGTAPSYFGGLYYDSGLVGVIIGSFLFGVLARVLYEYLLAYPASVGVRLLYAAALPFVVVLLRGNPTDALGRMGYVVFPILIAVWLTGERERVRHGTLGPEHVNPSLSRP